MARIVMKFGGTSMAGTERIRNVAARVKHEVDAGNQVAVVVSAMAGETDRLVNFCREAAPLHDPKDMTLWSPLGSKSPLAYLPLRFRPWA